MQWARIYDKSRKHREQEMLRQPDTILNGVTHVDRDDESDDPMRELVRRARTMSDERFYHASSLRLFRQLLLETKPQALAVAHRSEVKVLCGSVRPW